MAIKPACSAHTVTAERIREAMRVTADVARQTPVLTSRTMSERMGATVVFKAENLQRTGSFKLRGALAKIAALERERVELKGVVCGSAGNHAQAVAYAARARGLPCEVFMPQSAPIAKAEAASALGATVRLVGASVDDAVAAAQAHASAARMTFIHPFDDLDVIAGQGGVGLELAEQVPDLDRVVVPIGGGGLISGIAVALKSALPHVKVIGVQVEGCAPVKQSLEAGSPVPLTKGGTTIADGIAVKRPGSLTLDLIRRWVDDVLIVGEDQVAEAMVFLLERAKLVVEGAGAVGVAAALSGQLGKSLGGPGSGAATAPKKGVTPPVETGTTAIVLSGGNVDAGLLAQVTRRHETQAGRRLVLRLYLEDGPGLLAGLLKVVADAGANVLEVQHIREGVDLHVRETLVQLVVETRGKQHTETVGAALSAAGYLPGE